MKKICLFCKEKKEHYAKGYCKNCYARYLKRGTPEYYEPQSEEERLRKAREYSRKYRKEHYDKHLKSVKNWEEKNKERKKEYKKQWYKKNRERILKRYHDSKIKSEAE